MKAGLYEARSLIGGGAQLVVLDDAGARLKLAKAVRAMGEAYMSTRDPAVRRLLGAVLDDINGES